MRPYRLLTKSLPCLSQVNHGDLTLLDFLFKKIARLSCVKLTSTSYLLVGARTTLLHFLVCPLLHRLCLLYHLPYRLHQSAPIQHKQSLLVLLDYLEKWELLALSGQLVHKGLWGCLVLLVSLALSDCLVSLALSDRLVHLVSLALLGSRVRSEIQGQLVQLVQSDQ